MSRLSRPVDDATHDRKGHVLDTVILDPPFRHLRPDVLLHRLGELLKKRTGGAPATRAGSDHRRECTQAHRLQQFLGNDDFTRARFVRLGRQRNADRVADAFLQQHRQCSRRRNNALRSHAGLGQTEVQGVIAARSEIAIDRNQLLHAGNLAREDDLVAPHSELFGARRGIQRRADQGLARDTRRGPGLAARMVLVHQRCHHVLIERTPVRANAHRLGETQGGLDDCRELTVLLASETDVAGIDPILRQCFGGSRLIGQQLMPVVVEIADQRHLHTHHGEAITDSRNRSRSLGIVDRQAHQFGTAAGKLGDLSCAGDHIRRVGIGHRLHDHRCSTADQDRTNADTDAVTPRHRAIGRTAH